MRIITEGAKQLLMDRLQCMRDTNGDIYDAIIDLNERRSECCGYPYPPEPPPQPGETFYILTEDDQFEIDEDGSRTVQEMAP